MHRLSHGLWNPPPTIVCLHRCETTRPSEQEEGKGVEEMRPHLGRSRWRSRTRKKKRQRGNMNLHSLLFRDLVVSAKVSIRRIKGGNNGIHTFFLIPTSAALPLVFFHYTTATLVFLFCFFYLSLSFPLYFFSFTKLVPLLPPGPSWSNYFSMTLESILFFSSSSPSDFRIRVSEEMEFFGPTHHNLVAGRWLVV